MLSGPAALLGFNLKSCLDTPETDIIMSCMEGELCFLGSMSSTRCRSFRGTSLVKTEWNWVFKIRGDNLRHNIDLVNS